MTNSFLLGVDRYAFFCPWWSKSEGYRLPMPWLRETNSFRCARHTAHVVKLQQKTYAFRAAACDISRGLEPVPVTWTRSELLKIGKQEDIVCRSIDDKPSNWLYATEPVYDPEIVVVGRSVTELSSICRAHHGFYNQHGRLSSRVSVCIFSHI
jgi:hypothetical protein